MGNVGYQRLCAWAGPLFVLMFGLGFWVCAGYLPPHAPSADAEHIAAIYREHTTMIRLGQLLLMIGACLMVVFVSAISALLERIESSPGALGRTQLVSGTVAALTILGPSLLWTAAAFRPERAPEITQMLNDLGWLTMLMTFPPFFLQMLAIGIVIMGDRSARPLLPRWAGFFNIWVAVLLMPGALVSFLKTGPFAWNGLFGFWVPAVAFFFWVLVMSALVLKAIGQGAPRVP